MKIRLAILVILLPLLVFAQTNTVPTPPPYGPDTSSVLKPILDLLGGKGTWLTTIMAWGAALSAVLAPFAVWIRNKLADMMNAAAESSDENDDVWLRRLFSRTYYQFLAFLLNFINVRLPTLAELERAIELQRQAVVDAIDLQNPQPPN